MKIYKRSEFMELPAGTFFMKGELDLQDDGVITAPTEWGKLKVKDNTINHGDGNCDWFEYDLDWPEQEEPGGGGFLLEAYNDMYQNKASRNLDTSLCRDALYELDTDVAFMVYETADLLQLRAMIDKAIEVSRGPGA